MMKVEGIEQTSARLARLDTKVATTFGKKATRAGAKVMLKATQSEAPFRKGIVRASLRIKAAKRQPGIVGFIVSMGKKAYAGKAYYGSFLLHGWHAGKRVAKARPKLFRKSTATPDSHRFVSPNPFLAVAYAKANSAAVEEMQAKLVELVNADNNQ